MTFRYRKMKVKLLRKLGGFGSLAAPVAKYGGNYLMGELREVTIL